MTDNSSVSVYPGEYTSDDIHKINTNIVKHTYGEGTRIGTVTLIKTHLYVETHLSNK